MNLMPLLTFRRILVVTILGAVAIVLHFWGAQIGPSYYIEHMIPGLISDESWRRAIAKDPTANGYSAYGVLQSRGSDVARSEAIRDVQSSDSYLWLNAALYLGELGDPIAVPYLIRGLRHRASRAHGEALNYLQVITRQNIGKNQTQWIKWWQTHNPTIIFDFADQGVHP